MKRFYCTTAPDRATSGIFLKETLNEAIAQAKAKIANEHEQTVYIVQVIRKVARSTPPVKVSVVR